MTLSRRTLLGSGLAAGTALAFNPHAFAQAGPPPWTLGYATPPAQGFGPSAMKLVSGKAPAGFKGSYYRNGPAQFRHGDAYASHWFDGDGMVHRIAIEDGKALHTGRFVATRKHKDEMAAGKFLAPGFGTAGDPSYSVASPDDLNAGNTAVVMSGGEMLALWEAGSAFRLDPVTLETRGPKIWRKDLAGMPFLAHPKREPDGRLWNLAVASLGTGGSQVGIYRIGVTGELEDFGVVNMGVPSYVHDWSITASKLVILVQPWVNGGGSRPGIGAFVWKPELGLRVLIVDKDDLKKQRWSQTEARAFYHTGAAWEESDGTIKLDVCFTKQPALGEGGGASEIRGEFKPRGGSPALLTQMVIPPTGDTKLVETRLSGDFPQVDPRRHGLRRRLTAIVGGGAEGRPGATTLYLQDWDTGKAQVYDYGPDYMAEEHLIIPKPGATGEREAWLVGTAINLKAGKSEFAVFDLADIEEGPLAVWRAGYSWPLGFHGTWA